VKCLVITELPAKYKYAPELTNLSFFPSFPPASGAVKKYQTSHLFSVIYAIFFLSFALFLKLYSAWIVTADRSVSDHFHTVDCCKDYVGFVTRIEYYQKNPRKPVISLSANFTEIFYVQLFH